MPIVVCPVAGAHPAVLPGGTTCCGPPTVQAMRSDFMPGRGAVTLAAFRGRRGRVTVRASVSPAHAGQRLLLEVGSGTSWKVLLRPRLDTHSRLKVVFLTLVGGSKATMLRATLPADSRNVQSSSAPVFLHLH